MPGKGDPLVVRSLEKGRYFGEKALLQEERRTATITAVTDVECLTLDREYVVPACCSARGCGSNCIDQAPTEWRHAEALLHQQQLSRALVLTTP